ncbi:MAG: FAD-binding oxidoreductase [Herminiimonas sp.]|nr:FAD-binding oxidoreductase [Herminiimonas sp.]
MNASFWELDAMQDAGCIVIGGGLIGLLTALEWRDTHPHERIIVLERGFLPAGASSRNAGFACFGSLTELLADIEIAGAAATAALVAQRWHGLARLRERVGDAAMGFENLGGYELLTESHLPALAHLDEVNRLLQPLFGSDVFRLDAAGLVSRRFGPQIQALVANRFESQIHSGKLMRALALQAGAASIEVRTGATVESIDELGDRVELRVRAADAMEIEPLRLNARCVAVCTNALTAALMPSTAIAPARGQILVTEPIADLAWAGCHHVDEGFYYFRNVGNRILLGGARNLDFVGERSTKLQTTDLIQTALQTMLEQVILPGRSVRIDYRWAGLMGFTTDKQPIVCEVSPRVALGFGCNGMGVALGADIAARTAALLP